MDSPDSPVARVERTFWSIWYYITGAVNRFLRPEPTNIENNDPDSIQESAVAAEPASCDHAEHNAGKEEVVEEQHLTTASQLSPSRPAVAWDLCTTEIDLGPDEESMHYKTQLNTGSDSKASEEGGGTREEQVTQTGNDAAEWLVTKDALQDLPEAKEDWKSHSRVQDEIHDACEDNVNTALLRPGRDAMSDDAEEGGREGGAKEENETSLTPSDHQKMDETMPKIQVNEEDNKMHPEEQHLEEEHTEVKLGALVDLSAEEKCNINVEEGTMQASEADTAVTHEEVESSNAVSQWACEIENGSDEGTKQDENQSSVCEQSENHRDFQGGPSSTSLHAELQMPCDSSGIVSEDELIVVGDDHVLAHRSESDEAEDTKEKEHESTLDESEQGAAVIEEETVSEAANNLRSAEVLEQKDNVKTVTEEEEEEGDEEEGEGDEEEEEEEEGEEDISTENAAFNEEAMKTEEPEPHTAEVIDGKEEGVAKDDEEQIKTREMDDVEPENYGKVIDEEPDVTATDVSVDERFFDKDQVEEENLSCGVRNNESNMEITTSITVKPEGETGQEITGEFKNIPPGMCEGQLVVLQGLNSPTCEETQEGVPEYNNERGPDENTTQRFLEDGDYKEIQATQLPEEVESSELESLQKAACKAGADYLMVREEQDRAEDIKSSFDLVVEDHTQLVQETEDLLVETAIQEAGHLLEEEEGKSLIESMKTGTDRLEKQSDISQITNDTDEATKELQDGIEGLVVEFEKDESVCGSEEDDTDGVSEDVVADKTLKSLEVKEQKIAETSFFQESIDAINSEQNNTSTASMQEDFAGSGLLKELDEPKVLEEQDVGVDMEERIYGAEEEAGEEEMKNKNETEILNLQLTDTPAEQITERSALIEETELSGATESDEALERSTEEMLPDAETAEESITTKESIPTRMAGSEDSYTKETLGSIGGRQDVIDEEILDLWIQTAMSEDADDVKQQEGPELVQQTDTNVEPSDGEQDEMSSEKEKEQLMDSGELLSDTEVSSLTAESGFLDQSLSEEGPHNSERQLLKSTSSGSFQGINDMLADMSESEVSAQHPNRESQEISVEETAETERSYLKEEVSITETGFHPDSGVTSSNQESQRKTDDEPGSQTETDDEATHIANKTDTEEEDVETEMNAAEEAEETEAEEEGLEIVTVSESPDETKPTESGRSRSDSEASLEEGIVSTESGSHDDTFTESEKLLNKLPSVDTPQCEDITDSLPGLHEAEVAEQLMFDQMEVDASLLDSTLQRSRISVKNPRIRPPKDPRSLLHMPSLEPTPSSRPPVKVPPGMPMGGLGIGIKLPGLGAGFPVLKKTQRTVRDENSPDNVSQEPETKPEEQSDTPKQEEAPHKPKWMPPKHPGFGNPLMSELKTKLKKTTKE